MRAFLLSCAVCVPLLVIHYFIARAPGLPILTGIFNVTVGVIAGSLYGLFANQTENQSSLVRLLIGSAITGIVVTSVQYWVILGASISSYWGALLGGVGAAVHLAFKRPSRGKEDPDRELRFQQAINHQGSRNENMSEGNRDDG